MSVSIPIDFECKIDHVHEESWVCDSGYRPEIHLNAIQEDFRRLTEAVNGLAEALSRSKGVGNRD